MRFGNRCGRPLRSASPCGPQRGLSGRGRLTGWWTSAGGMMASRPGSRVTQPWRHSLGNPARPLPAPH
eukprot:1551928-Alexandrium_andersonii.AAC.1